MPDLNESSLFFSVKETDMTIVRATTTTGTERNSGGVAAMNFITDSSAANAGEFI